ncbi:MAG: ATP-binding protein [Balneolaceae bacterium]|nr:MAG: ATP-binding protein [Balneolaceae bacterium]
MKNHPYQLILSSSYEEAEVVPSFVSKIAMECGLDEECESTLMLLLSEAVTNAIVHGNKSDPAKKVRALLEVHTDEVVVTVSDEGEGFDPAVQKNPLDEENLLKSGGRGLFLIQELADSYEYRDHGTTLCFTVKRRE